MRIKQHDRSHSVKLSDDSEWCIWPGDTPKALRWRSTTEIEVADIDDEICSHALINRSDGSRVRVIRASADWRSLGRVKSRNADLLSGPPKAVRIPTDIETDGWTPT